MGVALVWLWWRFRVALGWLWRSSVLRSLCLVYAYYMALGWLWVACAPSPFKVRSSTFDVRRSACAPDGLKVLYGACPASVR